MAEGLIVRQARTQMFRPVGLVTGLLAVALLVWAWAELASPATNGDRAEDPAVTAQPSSAARASGRMRPLATDPVPRRSASESFAARAAARSRSSRVGPGDRARASRLAARRVGTNATVRRDWIVATGDGR
jgi:hypothetical protein